MPKEPNRSGGGEPKYPTLGIALLDATGLGLGHLAMRRLLGALGLLLGTVVMALISVVVPGIAAPLLLAGWLVASGIIGYRAANLHAWARHARLYLVLGIAGLVALAAGYWLYVDAADQAYASAVAAHQRGDCGQALHSYERLESIYSLSYRSFDGLGEKKRECKEIKGLDGLVEQERFTLAISGYEYFESEHPEALIDSSVLDSRISRAYVARGDDRFKRSQADDDENLLLEAAQSYDLAVARDASSEAMNGLYRVRGAAFSRGLACSRAAYLDALSSGDFTSYAAYQLRIDARSAEPALMLRCGQVLLSSGHAREATTMLDLALKRYPRARTSSATRRLWIRAEIAAARKRRSGHLPPPSPSGSAPSGTVELVVGNDSRYALQVFLAGPRASEFHVPACDSCSDYRTQPTSYSCDSKPSHTVTLRPGRYDVEVKARGKTSSIEPFTGSWSLTTGTRYSHCLFVVVR